MKVEQEEKRIQASLQAFLESEKNAAADGMLPTELTKPKKEEEASDTPHLGQKLSSVSLRQIWTYTAKVLIRLVSILGSSFAHKQVKSFSNSMYGIVVMN